MATKNTLPAIQGEGKTVLVLGNSDYSALTSLLFELSQDERKIRKIAQENSMALASNQITALSDLWEKLNLG